MIAAIDVPLADLKFDRMEGTPAVVKSIRTLGVCWPVVIDRQNNVLVGRVRCTVAEQMGKTTVPCVYAGDLDTVRTIES